MTRITHLLSRFQPLPPHGGPKCGLLPHCLGRLWFKVFGWELQGRLPDTPQFLLIGAPHTSNWDLPFALAAAYSMRLSISWLGKDSLFRFPFSTFFTWLGGIPVDRSTPKGAVTSIVRRFEGGAPLAIVLSPPGTRSRRTHWRSGFYYIALQAQVPIVCGALDYQNRRVLIGETFVPTGDREADMARIRQFYSGIQGKYPERITPVELEPPAR